MEIAFWFTSGLCNSPGCRRTGSFPFPSPSLLWKFMLWVFILWAGFALSGAWRLSFLTPQNGVRPDFTVSSCDRRGKNTVPVTKSLGCSIALYGWASQAWCFRYSWGQWNPLLIYSTVPYTHERNVVFTCIQMICLFTVHRKAYWRVQYCQH